MPEDIDIKSISEKVTRKMKQLTIQFLSQIYYACNISQTMIVYILV